METPRATKPLLAFGIGLALLAGCAQAPVGIGEAPPVATPCPAGVPAGARCLRGQDSAGAHYLLVVPARWNQVLLVHAHGGPTLGPPQAVRLDEDIRRWKVVLEAGYAWAA